MYAFLKKKKKNQGHDGCIYGIPNCSTTALRITPGPDDAVTATTFGDVGEGFGKWHGGCVARDGYVCVRVCVCVCTEFVIALGVVIVTVTFLQISSLLEFVGF